MIVIRQIQIGAVRYKKGDVIDVKKLTKEQISHLVESGHLQEVNKAKGAK
ncbi:hypothetical protein [Wohlfahrtiimonas larvae]|uniref:Uncharacterized protein n=1 Tax=Wohlfahrtiimonas larvae TaxID=1157986 RepID=A0ABP9MY74_9GAMM|nr:hypothetical protein [Wohlfahrtiimonas larvae]